MPSSGCARSGSTTPERPRPEDCASSIHSSSSSWPRRKWGFVDRVREGNLGTVEALAAIVEEGKAQGRIRADVDAKRVAWRLLGFYWFEDVSSLMHLDEVVDEGISTEMLEDVLADITTD